MLNCPKCSGGYVIADDGKLKKECAVCGGTGKLPLAMRVGDLCYVLDDDQWCPATVSRVDSDGYFRVRTENSEGAFANITIAADAMPLAALMEFQEMARLNGDRRAYNMARIAIDKAASDLVSKRRDMSIEKAAFMAGVELAYDWPPETPLDDRDVDAAISQWLASRNISTESYAACEAEFWRGVRMMTLHAATSYISVGMAAQRKGVKPETIHKILSDDARRVGIFPNARKMFEGLRAPWELDIRDVDAWRPQRRSSRR